jgi:hypothetical protein
MLTKFEIDAQYYKLSKHLINKNESPVNTGNQSLSYLMDSNGRLIAIGTHRMSCQSMAIFNKTYIPTLFNSINNSNLNINIQRDACWKLKKFGNPQQSIWQEDLNIESIEDLYEIVLVNQKVALLDKIYDNINATRNKTYGGLVGQNFIYFSKYLEAKEIMEKNIESDPDFKYPYTTGYATLMNLSLQESAKAIILQFDSVSGAMSESENIRLKYKNLVINEKDIANLKHIYKDFLDLQNYGCL